MGRIHIITSKHVEEAEMDLTEAFLEGYNAQDPQIDNPYLWSSPNWLAYVAGGRFAKLGTSTPIKCKAGRGNRKNYKIRIFRQHNEWLAIPDKTLTSWDFQRK
jgi:hypothetical protein